MKKDGPDGTYEYYCDAQGCGKRIFPLDLHVRFSKCTLMGGGQGELIYLCRQCFTEKFGINPKAFDDIA